MREIFRHINKLPLWQMMILAIEDGFMHVSLQNHQRDKSVRADYLADEVLHRFAQRMLKTSESLGLFKEAERLTIQLERARQGLEGNLKKVEAFPQHATHPKKFMDAAEFMLAQTRGFLGMENAVKSGTTQLRKMLYPEPPKTRPTELDKFFAAHVDPNGEGDRVRALSDSTLAVKVVQMTSQNELARPGSVVYGTATLKVYLPRMLTGLLEGISSEAESASLKEYVDSTQHLLGHLQRCQRQVDLLIDPSPQL